MTNDVSTYRYAGLIALLVDYAWPRRNLGGAALPAARRKISKLHPWARGIRLRASDRAHLATTLREHDQRSAAEEEAAIDAMPFDELLEQARLCMHAQNRRAKHFSCDDAGEIYSTKNKYLEACILAGRCNGIEHFAINRPIGYYCGCCAREWYGRSDICYGCDGYGDPVDYEESHWYVVDLGDGYRFHQPQDRLSPGLIPAIRERAVAVEPHDPTQAPRQIPDLGLSDKAQIEVIRRATAALSLPGAA